MADNNSSTTGSKEPTPGDISFMVHVFRHMQEKPVLDWDAFAVAAGFKSAGVALTRYGQIKRKFGTNEMATTPVKKRKAAGEGNSASKVNKTGAGRVGTKGKKGKTASMAEENEDYAKISFKTEESVDYGASSIKKEDFGSGDAKGMKGKNAAMPLKIEDDGDEEVGAFCIKLEEQSEI
ncbi:uncharacterized protein CTRU02_203761 [Colletotrichum truncatum]|uniref:Uncharacterized protein n=1 Tax=Colletotrichum truncatum TaxID=5467 RepID=A0ACC3ZAV4_COLTU|nr:uncharacterized protein CTRU02_04093 [Colletotrichum truncatum]KAF6796132.1 hypothetical protein CTRU02_04093 [Colletotrichum truncatum]